MFWVSGTTLPVRNKDELTLSKLERNKKEGGGNRRCREVFHEGGGHKFGQKRSQSRIIQKNATSAQKEKKEKEE